jgi:hypothetical protein
MSGAGPRDGRAAGLRRQAGRDDGRMYGSSDLGYQGTLKRLTANQRESNTARTAAHKAAQTETFMTGLEAKTNTVSQAACINELVGLIKTHPRLTENDKQIPFVIAVDRWTPGMMGRAAAAVKRHDDLGYDSMFLGYCAAVVDLVGTKDRTSACIAQHWLHDDFPERKGKFEDKNKARAALADEIEKAGYGRQLCFVDASVTDFTRFDWEEAEKVSVECDAVVIVCVASKAAATLPAVEQRKRSASSELALQPSKRQRAEAELKKKRDSERKFPCLDQPEDSLARPRAHLRAQQIKKAAAAAAAQPTLTQQLYRDIKGMLEDPADGSWHNIRKRQVDKLSAKVGELSQETQLTAQQTVRLKKARAVLGAGGPYVSDTEGESDSDSDSEEDDGHHWRCCKERCVCQFSSGIGAQLA